MKRACAIAIVVLSVLGGGCASLDEAEDPTEGVSEEALKPPPGSGSCTTTQDSITRYYSSPAMTTQVGSLTCSCGQLYQSGQTTNYSTFSTYPYCII